MASAYMTHSIDANVTSAFIRLEGLQKACQLTHELHPIQDAAIWCRNKKQTWLQARRRDTGDAMHEVNHFEPRAHGHVGRTDVKARLAYQWTRGAGGSIGLPTLTNPKRFRSATCTNHATPLTSFCVCFPSAQTASSGLLLLTPAPTALHPPPICTTRCIVDRRLLPSRAGRVRRLLASTADRCGRRLHVTRSARVPA